MASYIDGSLTSPAFERRVAEVTERVLPLSSDMNPSILRAVAACSLGAQAEDAAEHVDWRGFEDLCAALLRAAGYSVSGNIFLRRPRAQIDILARGSGSALVVDCKRWAKEMGPAGLSRAVSAQARRAALLRAKMPEVEPMVVVIVSLANESARFVDGGAIVPLTHLGDFATNLHLYTEQLETI